MPDHGLYHPKFDGAENTMAYLQECFEHSDKPTVAVIFYRCHYLSGNRAFVDALLDELEVLGVHSIGLFTETLRAAEPMGDVNGHAVERFPTALTYLLHPVTAKSMVDVLISSMVRYSVYTLLFDHLYYYLCSNTYQIMLLFNPGICNG
jgi:cobaltochelatase CobN